ncbi:MAG: hypothetical protein OEZ43_05175 [Gammaproteobacteria bacterium]|nr:hypothetical protein [Gammaproteobacteria bacterium]
MNKRVIRNLIFLAIMLSSSMPHAGILDKRDLCQRAIQMQCLFPDSLHLITEIPGDLFATAIYPFSHERIYRTGFDFASTLALMPADEPLTRGIWRIRDWGGEWGLRPKTHQDWYIPGFLFYDSIMTYALPAMYVGAALANNRRLYRASYFGMKVWAYTIAVPLPFRYAVQRSYPSASDGGWNSPFEFHSRDAYDRNQAVIDGLGAFPSFRAAMWFGLADVFASEYQHAWAWYSAATALTLLADHGHWATDLLFGAYIGLSVSQSVRTRYRYNEGGFFEIRPFFAGGTAGVRMEWLYD